MLWILKIHRIGLQILLVGFESVEILSSTITFLLVQCPCIFFRNRKTHVTGGALISSDGSAEKIAGPGCTRAAFALAPLAHHRAIVALLSDAHQLVQHLHPHQQVHQRR